MRCAKPGGLAALFSENAAKGRVRVGIARQNFHRVAPRLEQPPRQQVHVIDDGRFGRRIRCV